MATDWNNFTPHHVAEFASRVSKGIFERQLYTGWGGPIAHSLAVGKPAETWALIWEDAVDNKAYTGPMPWFCGFLMWDIPPREIGSLGDDVDADDWAWTINQGDDWPTDYPFEIAMTPAGVDYKDAETVERLGVCGPDSRNGKIAVARKDGSAWEQGARIWLVGVPYLEPDDFRGIPVAAEPNKIYETYPSSDWTGGWSHWGKWTAVHVYDFLLQALEYVSLCRQPPDLGSPETVWRLGGGTWGYTYPGPQYWCGHKRRIFGYCCYLSGETFYGVSEERVPNLSGGYYDPWAVISGEAIEELESNGMEWSPTVPRTGIHVNNSAYNRAYWAYLEGVLKRLNCVQYYISPGEPERLSNLMYGCGHAESSGSYGYGQMIWFGSWVDGPEYAFLNRGDNPISGSSGTAWLKSPTPSIPFPMMFPGKVGAYSGEATQMFVPAPRTPPYPPYAPESVYSEQTSSTTLPFPTRLLSGQLVRGVRKLLLIANISEMVSPFGVEVTDDDGETYDVIPEVKALPNSYTGLTPARHPLGGPFYVVKTYVDEHWPTMGSDTPGLSLSASITQAKRTSGEDRFPRTSGEVNTGAAYSFRDYVHGLTALYEDLYPHESYYGEYTYCVVKPPFVI